MVEQVEVLLELPRTKSQSFRCLLQPLLRAGTLNLDLEEPLVDLVAGQFAVRCEVEEPFLLIRKLVELLAVGHMHAANVCLGVLHRDVDGLTDELQELAGQPEACVVIQDVPLNVEGREVRKVALPSLTGEAHVVGVSAAVAAGLGVDEPGRSALGSAPIAVEQSL